MGKFVFNIFKSVSGSFVEVTACLLFISCSAPQIEPSNILCNKPNQLILVSAKEFLESKSFTIESINSDQGMLKTQPKKIETVNELISAMPKFITASLEIKEGKVFIRGYLLTYKVSSYNPANKIATYDPNDLKETELQQDERMFKTHIQPLVSHVQELCSQK